MYSQFVKRAFTTSLGGKFYFSKGVTSTNCEINLFEHLSLTLVNGP